MPRPYKTEIWKLEMPEGWKVSDRCGQTLVTLYRPDGIGLLTILTAEEQEPTTVRGRRLPGSVLPDAGIESHYRNRFSRSWSLSCHGHRIYVRYTCAAHHSESERSEVDEIVRTLSERDENQA